MSHSGKGRRRHPRLQGRGAKQSGQSAQPLAGLRTFVCWPFSWIPTCLLPIPRRTRYSYGERQAKDFGCFRNPPTARVSLQKSQLHSPPACQARAKSPGPPSPRPSSESLLSLPLRRALIYGLRSWAVTGAFPLKISREALSMFVIACYRLTAPLAELWQLACDCPRMRHYQTETLVTKATSAFDPNTALDGPSLPDGGWQKWSTHRLIRFVDASMPWPKHSVYAVALPPLGRAWRVARLKSASAPWAFMLKNQP